MAEVDPAAEVYQGADSLGDRVEGSAVDQAVVRAAVRAAEQAAIRAAEQAVVRAVGQADRRG